MDYSRHYQHLIAKHGYVTKPDDDNYYERHHIIPKSLGGSNKEDNLTYLTGKAHYVAHYLLYKIHGTGPMAYAFAMTSMMDEDGRRHVPNGRSYAVALKARSIAMTGRNNPRYGVAMSSEHKAKISASNKGRKHSAEAKAKMSKIHKGTKHNLAKPANVYCYNSGELLASNVLVSLWCRENGQHSGNLHATAKADRTKPHNYKTNPRHAKGAYAVYIKDEHSAKAYY